MKFRLKGVERIRVKGRDYYYYRPTRRGERVRLKGNPGTPEFIASYQAATALKPNAVVKIADPGSFHMLCKRYLSSGDFSDLGELNQKELRRVIERLQREHGTKPVSLLQRKHILDWKDRMKDRPGAANTMMRTISILMSYAVDHGFRADNPAYRLKKYKQKRRKAWKPQQLAAFEERWPLGTPQRTGYALARYTALRRSDIPKLQWIMVAGDAIVGIMPNKTRDSTEVELRVPIHPELAKALTAAPRTARTILTGERGSAISDIHFGSMMSDAIKAAGLPNGKAQDGCTLHGLRSTATKDLLESGSSNSEAMAITGHASDSMLRRYGRDARQKGLAEQAMERWTAREKAPSKGA